MAPSASMNVEHTIPCASTVPIGIPRTISQVFKRDRESDAFMEKEDTCVEKLDFSVGKESVVALKPS